MPTDSRPTLAEARDGTRVVRSHRHELPAILEVQHRAFLRVASMYGLDQTQLPPLGESLDDLERVWDGDSAFFSAIAPAGTVVGSVRAERRGRTVEISRLAVDDAYLRRGIARALMEGLEISHPDANRFELFTGAEADIPLALYEKLGYREYRHKDVDGIGLVWLEKCL